MNSFFFDIITGAILLFVGVFFNRICKLPVLGKYLTLNPTIIRYTRLSLVVVAILYFVTVCLISKFVERSTIDLLRIILLTIGSVILLIGLILIAKGGKARLFILSFSVLSLLVVGFSMGKLAFITETRITFEHENMQIEGDYRLTLALHSIDRVVVLDTIPRFAYRTNGLKFMKISQGYFELADGRECFVGLANNESAPLLKISRKDDIPIYLNFKTPEETLFAYEEIRKKLSQTQQ